MHTDRKPTEIFRFEVPTSNPFQQALLNLFRGVAERLFSLDDLNAIYADALATEGTRGFNERLIDALDLRCQVSEADLARIPAKGGVIVVANHPFGGIEGVVMGALLSRVRPDVKIMANYLLHRIPELREHFIFVDPFGTKEASLANRRPLKETMDWLRNGGILGVFPAGEVSHYTWKNGGVTDPGWNESIARIARATQSTVVPMYFDGSNGMLFQMAGLLHPRLRTALLPKEFANKRGKEVVIRIGNPISPKKFADFETDRALIDYLRKRTYLLANRADEAPKATPVLAARESMMPVMEPVEPHLLAADLDRIRESSLLLSSGEYDVYCAPFDHIPNIMLEIGRLRELTFRDTNEGTGKAVDLDDFDLDYLHLFVWNRDKAELVGAYRLGQTDVILEKRGVEGLYTHTLFQFDRKLVEKFSPALEMGRSFVRKEYQRGFAPLLLLWKGIGTFVSRNPRYAVLFGPVSISNDYQTVSRQLIVTFLKVHNFKQELARLIRARSPFKPKNIKGLNPKETIAMVRSLEEVDDLVAELESDRKGVPILLKQYLKLGGKLLGFNVDPEFSDVLDGLILVDLRQTDPVVLARYMGKEEAKAFLGERLSVIGDQ